MKTFKVGIVLEQGGYVHVQAETLAEAEKKVTDSVSEYDFDKLDVDITSREFYTIDSEEVA